MREFHISKKIRREIDFDETLFHTDGNIVFANFHAVRKFVKKLNDASPEGFKAPDEKARASDINAIGLIDEIFHYLIGLYEKNKKANAMEALLQHLYEEFSQKDIDKLLTTFVDNFPPNSVYTAEIGANEYINEQVNGRTNRSIILEEILILWLANANPAYYPYYPLFTDEILKEETKYEEIISEIAQYFSHQPSFGPFNLSLVEMLRSPAKEEPKSISRQLEYIRKHWGYLLGDLMLRLLSGLDLLREEEKLSFPGPGPVEIPLYDSSYFEYLGGARYSQDKDWMPNLVMIAKNTFVWLHQLSEKYQRQIRTLSDIPEEELLNLARWGVNGLWLIGIWERSKASARIKQLCGNPEAISSAYALYDYQIADDLGGETAYQNLNERARKYGIRLASDMVPNHTAIDSRWIRDHPDWYISLPYSPFPSYQFSGPNLSNTPEIGIYIEDHYYDRSDAAVVFKHVDHQTGEERFIYHGNDGTSYPWNDTAQLNYLKAEVREAVIQTIIQVAKRFKVIRFDAAMTLTKRHFHRLWFPEPGSGGDIPSRADHAMSDDQFNRAMPKEFWREVVERVSDEVPDTLLLAEAFWMMESYFVRTLGMHRVYNSAFMNLLRDEANAKYRSLMKNTLEFDPQILKRFVNFMNNPDEQTAVDQFGKGDKYFGICTLMVTLPGLPMFGHGQIEGFSEKYGMEYKRSYWDEIVDQELVSRHESEIFPLLHKRNLFANVEHFQLYDFYTHDGHVNEDVFAYSNRAGSESVLVLYNNRFSDTSGWVHMSVGFVQKGIDESEIVQRSLAEGLEIRNEDRYFTIYKDQITQVEFICKNNGVAENGLYFSLNAYQKYVLMDFRQIFDDDGSLQQLHDHLAGRGVSNIEKVRRELKIQPLLTPFNQLFDPELFKEMFSVITDEGQDEIKQNQTGGIVEKINAMVEGLSVLVQPIHPKDEIVRKISDEFKLTLDLFRLEKILPEITMQLIRPIHEQIIEFIGTDKEMRLSTLLSWIFLHNLGKIASKDDFAFINQTWFEEWQLQHYLNEFFTKLLSESEDKAQQSVQWLKTLIGETELAEKLQENSNQEIVRSWFHRDELMQTLEINRYEDTVWFSKEKFEDYLSWFRTIHFIQLLSRKDLSKAKAIEVLKQVNDFVEHLKSSAASAGYQLETFIELV